jgi:hypothetical protein
MTLSIVAEAAPLKVTADGVVRVGKTRVTLDTIVAVFKQGATAEEEDILLVVDCSLEDELPGQIQYLPL